MEELGRDGLDCGGERERERERDIKLGEYSTSSRLPYLAAIVEQFAGGDLLVVACLKDDRGCRVSAVVSESLRPISRPNAEVLKLRLGGGVGELCKKDDSIKVRRG